MYSQNPQINPPIYEGINPFKGTQQRFVPQMGDVPTENPSFEQEEGYPPPDPSLYDFYASDPSMQAYFKSQCQPQFTFARRINKMNWDLISNIDVSTIARNGDFASIEYLMHPIAFANITQDDLKHFNDRGALHAFLILQMAVEVLLVRIGNTPLPSAVNQQKPIEPNPQITAQYEARIDLLKKDIKSRDNIINSLTERVQVAEQERDELKTLLRTSKESPKTSKSSKPVKQSKQHKKTIQYSSEESDETTEESGALHIDTQYIRYKQERPHVATKRKQPVKYKKKPAKSESSSSGWT
ncbi:hypothetical protein GPJ56_003415 [Histomonas meleagridis]|uniref:uncharacterized protein n=1 Tax=Histomonas meleagridis TaxID=135588 RepID=UPI0035594D65|nr:hypothetical protein GPJ56_003415 [Histomonas meleagridis]KAH0799106.1 hypothetical protein GO595_007903 [Histomonas meleagridis]